MCRVYVRVRVYVRAFTVTIVRTYRIRNTLPLLYTFRHLPLKRTRIAYLRVPTLDILRPRLLTALHFLLTLSITLPARA